MNAQLHVIPRSSNRPRQGSMRQPLLDVNAISPTVRRLCWGCAKPFRVIDMKMATYNGSRCWECPACEGSGQNEDEA